MKRKQIKLHLPSMWISSLSLSLLLFFPSLHIIAIFTCNGICANANQILCQLWIVYSHSDYMMSTWVCALWKWNCISFINGGWILFYGFHDFHFHGKRQPIKNFPSSPMEIYLPPFPNTFCSSASDAKARKFMQNS